MPAVLGYGVKTITIEEFELAIDLLKDWRIDRFYIGNQSMFVCADCKPA